eukprot:15476348-Alexandrium_andersonii.AAC.1
MLRPVSLDMSLDDLIEADRNRGERAGAGGWGSDPSSPPPSAPKPSGQLDGGTAKKGNRPGQRARRAA